ncbi:MAG: ComEC/Rec2 family competence protein [Kiritimatiellia bacterium]
MTAYRVTGIAAGLVAGIVLATYTSITIPLAILLFLLVAGTFTTAAGWRADRHWIEWPRSIIFMAALAAALPLGYGRTRQVLAPSQPTALRTHLMEFESGERVTLRGVIATEPELRGWGQVDVTLRVQQMRRTSDPEDAWLPVSHGNVLVRIFGYRSNRPETIESLHALALPAAYGNEIQIHTTYQPSETPRNPYAFDYAAFLRQNGIETSMRAHITRVDVLAQQRGNPLTALALQAKTSFLETFKRTIRAPASRIAAAATLGTRRAVERRNYREMDIAEMFRHAGVGHVLAVSGLHVSVIAVLLFALFRMTGASPRVFVPPLIFFLILFALLTGARPSSVRAVVMNSVILFTIAYFRCNLRTATTIGLSASAFVILLKNPLLLLAPSFLLSYGAVLSLIVLAPPFDRFLCTLRGFSAIFFLIWFSLLMAIAGWHLHWLMPIPNILAMAGALWLLTVLGSKLNHAIPRMWNTGFARMPALLRMFIAAQLAIQVGMMIPLSAWFFGRFPVAGILVNLIAIPTVGILVQLGMLLGLIGMIPVIGNTLALPFGAATSVVGEFFLSIAYAGARLFPFPATPRPSVIQLGIYYSIVGAVLLAEQNRHVLLDGLYRMLQTPRKYAAWLTQATILGAIGLTLLPLAMQPHGRPKATHMQILASSRYPLITIQGGNKADLIHAGGRFEGPRVVFDHLRARGAVRLGNVYLPSPDPRAGIEGTAALAQILSIDRVLLPVLPESGQSFADALGDAYLIRTAAEGVPWAVNYNTAFEKLTHAHNTIRNPAVLQVLEPGAIQQQWSNATMQTLPVFDGTVPRFLTSARTPILRADLHGLVWIIISDTLPEALSVALAETDRCDVLVVADISSRATYFRWVREATERLQPDLLIIAGDTPIEWNATQRNWLEQQEQAGRQILQIATDGAITGSFRKDGSTTLQTYRTNKRIPLSPRLPFSL